MGLFQLECRAAIGTSQFAFGVVAGFVVARHEPISTMQHLPFAVRAGIEAPGIGDEKNEGGSDI